MSLEVRTEGLTLRYGATTAIDDLSVRLAPGRIHGLLGRNASGKTSLLSVLAAFRRATSGVVEVDGADPFENQELMSQTCLVREGGDIADSLRVEGALGFAGCLRPAWDQAYAEHLLERFGLARRERIGSLSRGQRSALGITLGLASRAPLTLLDEVHLGLDAPSRYVFYDELLADYVAHPRTFVVSSHLVDEIARVVEHVVVLDRGRLVVAADTEDLRSRGATLTGPAAAVDDLSAGLEVLAVQRLGRTASATVLGDTGPELRGAAADWGVDVGPVGLQDLVVHLTDPERSPR